MEIYINNGTNDMAELVDAYDLDHTFPGSTPGIENEGTMGRLSYGAVFILRRL